MSKAIDPPDAEAWANAHEKGSTNELDIEMDLYNNAQGRKVFTDLKSSNPTDSELEKEVLKRVSQGKLKRIVNGKLVATNRSDRK